MEEYLENTKARNVDKCIFKSEVEVINRLLFRSVEMQPVYDELESKLCYSGRKFIVDSILTSAAFYKPNDAVEMRAAQKGLISINKSIAITADKLSNLIKQREELSETSGIISYDDIHVLDWIDKATENHHLHKLDVAKPLENLRGQFDLKYWPDNSDVIKAISDFARCNKSEASDSLGAVLIASNKASMQDFLRVLLKHFSQCQEDTPEYIPDGFKFTDNSLANIINCSLGLVDDMVDAQYIKRGRQEIRRVSQKNSEN